jgi:plasmid stabilization system protein ParE
MRVLLERFALQELFDATNYYAAQSPLVAEKFISDFEHAVLLIQEHPAAFPERYPGYRRCLFKKFKFGLIYKVDQDQIVIVAVMNNYREPDYWHKRT